MTSHTCINCDLEDFQRELAEAIQPLVRFSYDLSFVGSEPVERGELTLSDTYITVDLNNYECIRKSGVAKIELDNGEVVEVKATFVGGPVRNYHIQFA